jgi:hypothetical protein
MHIQLHGLLLSFEITELIIENPGMIPDKSFQIIRKESKCEKMRERPIYKIGMYSEAFSKKGFWFKFAAGPRSKPEEYCEYFEDLKRGANKEIGPKDFFEIASNVAVITLITKFR